MLVACSRPNDNNLASAQSLHNYCDHLHKTSLSNIGDNEVKSATGDIVEAGELSSQLNAAVGLPASLFVQINNRSNIGLFFAFYESSSLFPIGKETDSPGSPIRNVVGSQVLAATVGSGINFQNLSETVTIVFRLQVPEGSVS